MGVKVLADAFFKRNLAERYIRELKLRMAILLDFKQLSLANWRQYLDHVVSNINNNREWSDRSMNSVIVQYFTNPPIVIPQTNQRLYRFKVKDRVVVDLTKAERRDLSFKYSLHPGCRT